MFRVVEPENPADYLTSHYAKGDYYLSASSLETIGQWRGQLAERFGIEGKVVDAETFRQLLAPRSPQGEKLCTRLKKDRRPGWEMAWDVPKSISIAALYDPRIEQAFQESVLEAMKELEAHIMARVRVANQNHNRITGNIIYNYFLHRTTRPLDDGVPDMQWHMHVYVFNITWDEVEQKYKAVELEDVFLQKPRELIKNKMQQRLKAMGYNLFVDDKRWGIDGIENHRDLILKFSRRSDQFKQLAEDLGIDPERLTAELRELMVKLSRKHKKKMKANSLDELKVIWEERMSPEEREAVKATIGAAVNSKAKAEEQKQDEQHAQKEQPKTEEKAKEQPQQTQEQKEETIKAKKPGVSQDGLTIIKLAKAGINRCHRLGGAQAMGKEEALFDRLSQHKGFASLARSQQITVEQLLTSSDQVMLLRGKNSERDAVLAVARDAVTALSGKQCFMTATSSAGRPGDDRQFFTLDRVLVDENVQKALAGNVLMVQDAGAMSKAALKALLETAHHHQFRVILAGGQLDKKTKTQLISRDMLYFLEKYAGLPVAKIGERGKDPLYAAAMEHFAKGDVGKMTELLQKIGVIQPAVPESKDKDRTYKALGDYYVKQVSEGRNPSAIVAGWQERDKITSYIRDELKKLDTKQQGSLKKCKDFRQMVVAAWSDESKAKLRYEPGQFIEFHKKTQGFSPVQRYKVTAAYGKALYLVPEDKKTHWMDKSINQARLFMVTKASVKHFTVYRESSIELGINDRISITKSRWTEDYKFKLGVNVSRDGLQAGWKKQHKRVERGLEGTVVKISRDTVTIKDMDGKKHTLSKDFGHWKYGYVTNRGQNGATMHHSESSLKHTVQRVYGMLARWSDNIKIFTHDVDKLRRGMVEGLGQRAAQMMAAVVPKEETKAQSSEPKMEKETINATRQRQEQYRREKTAENETRKRNHTRAKHAAYQAGREAKPQQKAQEHKPQERGRHL